MRYYMKIKNKPIKENLTCKVKKKKPKPFCANAIIKRENKWNQSPQTLLTLKVTQSL